MPFKPLRLSFADLDLEIRAFTDLTARLFLEEESIHVLTAYRERLGTLYRGAARAAFVDWEIPKETPVVTVKSSDYDRAATRTVHAEMSGRAKIKRIGNDLEFDDVATVIRIVETTNSGPTTLGAFHFDIGVVSGPGAFFHTKAEGEVEFPPEIPVPRMLGLPLMPVGALEFVIGELFQKRWPMHVDVDRREVIEWRSVQARRLFHYLNILRKHIVRQEQTPMVLLKRWKPEAANLFETDVHR